jgi:hypothetical protein
LHDVDAGCQVNNHFHALAGCVEIGHRPKVADHGKLAISGNRSLIRRPQSSIQKAGSQGMAFFL